LNEVPTIVSQLRYEEEQGKLNQKNIYKEISRNDYSLESNHKKEQKNHFIDTIKTIIENQNKPIYILDANYTTQWINSETKKTFNLSKSNNQPIHCYDLFFNNTSPCSFCPIQTSIKTKKPHSSFLGKNHRIIRKITSIPVFSDNKLITVIIQLDLQLQQRNFSSRVIHPQQTIINNAALGIIVLDNELNHITVNPTFSGMTGYEQTDLNNNGEMPVYWPKKFRSDIKTEINRLQQKGHLKMETYFQRKDKSLFPVSVIGSTFFDDNTRKQLMILIVDDITKTKATERELKISQLLLLSLIQNLEKKVKKRTKKIEELLQQKNEFINRLGHDLKNPLGPLINLIPLLLKNETDAHKKQILTVINRNANYMKNLITKTIELSQLSLGKTHLHFEQLNLTEICNESLLRYTHLIEDKNINVINQLPQCLTITADRFRLKELFDNILTNAIKHSLQNGTILITNSSTETTVTMSIKDTGIGMNKQQLTHVFDEFYKADPARHDFKSCGLGTSIMKWIVEKHGGHIKIESEGLGKGTTVTFTLQKSPSNEKLQNNKLKNGDPK